MAAGLLVAFGIGSTLGPFITSIMMSYFGPDALFLFPAVMLALLCLYLVQRIVRKDAIQIEDKEGFDLAATSAAVGGIVTPELLSEEDKYVVVPDEWEAEPQDEEVQEEGKLDEEPESTSNIVNPEE